MLAQPAPQPVQSVLNAIGSTPMVQLKKVVPPGAANVFVKLEYYNPTGSYKDRMALAMIEEAEKRGDLRPGMTVVEYTGGSTGSSLALICAVKGYKLKIVSSDAFAVEKLRTMQAFGANLTIVPSQNGKITPDLIPRLREIAKEIAAEGDTYQTDQFNNRDSLTGYANIAWEVIAQLNGKVDAFCGSVGTAGMLIGVAQVLRREVPNAKIYALEPATSAVLSGQAAGAHHVEGVGVGFIPPLLNKDYYDELRPIDEAEARQMARRMAKEEGIFAGTSSGLNVAAAVQIATELGEGHNVVTVACDSGLKYLAGDLYTDDL
jgi:cysteine synthase A